MNRDDTLESQSGQQVPKYGSKPFKPGLYLALFHGRVQRDEAMDDWGFQGPIIGPLQWAHTTYAFHLRILFVDAAEESNYFTDVHFPEAHDLLFGDDLIEYAGKFYGDWSVFYVPDEETRSPPDRFRKVSRRPCSVAVNDHSPFVTQRHAAA